MPQERKDVQVSTTLGKTDPKEAILAVQDNGPEWMIKCSGKSLHHILQRNLQERV
jgi:hypothetical protein